MNTLLLRQYNFLSIFKNIKSDKIGFYSSIFFHFLILMFAIGIPNFFGKSSIYVPNIIPIEIVNVTDVTSIPKKIEEKSKEKTAEQIEKTKKFNSSENQEIKKIEIKEKPKVEKKEIKNLQNSKEEVVIEKKIKQPIKIEEKKIIQKDENIEKLPSKIIQPKIKPKPKKQINVIEKKSDILIKAQPKPKPEPEFSIASMLKDLRNEKSTIKKIDEEKEVENENLSKENSETNEKSVQLSISEIDLLRQQLTSCWIAPAGAVIERGMLVKISAKIKQNKMIHEDSIRIVDTNISKSNPFYGPITESAMRTLLNPDCIPLRLPEKKYNLWKNLTITFDYSIMKGY